MAVYIALLRKDTDSDFSVDFPDFPGCVTAGGTIEEAFAMAHEALGGHVACMDAAGEPLPEPAALDAVLANPDNAGAVPFLVSLELPSKPVRVNVMIPDRDLQNIDNFAKGRGMSRSGFLVHAAKRAIAEATASH